MSSNKRKSSSDSTDGPESNKSSPYTLSTWRSVARGFGSATTSPLREWTLICTDTNCRQHDDEGNPVELHRPLQRATTLELMIIMTFHDIFDYPNDKKRNVHFRNWDTEDLVTACELSNNLLDVSRRFFEHGDRNPKMRELEAIFQGRGVEYVDRYLRTSGIRNERAEFFLGEPVAGVEHGPPSNQFMYMAVLKLLLKYTQGKFEKLDDYVYDRTERRFDRP